MPSAVLASPLAPPPVRAGRCRVVVIWIDWYAYHLARFAGLAANPELAGAVVGLELVSGIGVHAGQRFREELPAGVPVETLFPGENWADVGQLRIARRLWRRLGRLNPEVVLVPGYYTAPGVAAALWARLHGRRSVLMTESTRQDHRRLRLKEFGKGLLIRLLFDWAVAGGVRHAEYLQALGFPSSRVRRFYDVVDNEGLYRRAREAERVGRGASGLPEQYFLYVGRLAPEKNLHALIDAYLAHRAAGGLWSLILAGDGAERESLERRAARSRYGREIYFAGHKGSADLARYYAFAGCFVLPSRREPWGLVVNEAMACGLPVIVSTACGCADDLVRTGENGFLFDPRSPGQLAEALGAIEGLPEEQWARMSARSLARIRDYSPERFGSEVARIARAGP